MSFLMSDLEGDNIALSRADGGALLVLPAVGSLVQTPLGKAFTPNVAVTVVGPFSPGAPLGTLFAVFDFTFNPKGTGQALIHLNCNGVCSGPDQILMFAAFGDLLTSVTGGTHPAGSVGVTIQPASFASAALVQLDDSFSLTGQAGEGTPFIWDTHLAGVPLQGTPGHRCAVSVNLAVQNATALSNVIFSGSVWEQL